VRGCHPATASPALIAGDEVLALRPRDALDERVRAELAPEHVTSELSRRPASYSAPPRTPIRSTWTARGPWFVVWHAGCSVSMHEAT